MPELLKHKAKVINIDENGTATVEVQRGSACSACGEKSSCTIADDTNVRIRFKNSGRLKKGDTVEIGIEKKSFYKSLLAIYIGPIALMLVTALTADRLISSQLITAFLTLGSAGIYFLVIKILHNGKDKQSFRILN